MQLLIEKSAPMAKPKLIAGMVCLVALALALMSLHPTLSDRTPSASNIQAADIVTGLAELAFERSENGDRLRRWPGGLVILSFGYIQRYRWISDDAFAYDKNLSREQVDGFQAITNSVQDIVHQIVDETGMNQVTNRNAEGSFAIDFISKYTIDDPQMNNPYLDIGLATHLKSLNGRSYENALGRACFGRTSLYDRPFDPAYMFEGEIASASLWVNLDAPQAEIEKCVRLETFRLIGLAGKLTHSEDSIFSESNAGTSTLSPYDKALIRLLYDPRLMPGMTRDEVSRVIKGFQAK